MDAPIDRTRLLRRVNTLLVRRRQSMDLMDSMRKLEESNRALEQFAYAASHDPQEPLRMVSSYLRLLERRYGQALDEDAEEFLAYARDGADRMRDMIEGLLDYSRVDSAGEPLQSTDLESVLEDVLADLRMKIEETDADIEVEALPRVRGDPDQLRQLFQNLLGNAIEYSGDGDPRVEVAAERRSREDVPSRHPGDGPSAELSFELDSDEGASETDHLWVISVSDDGVGIPRDDQERIFEVFQRLHSHEECSGTGIGLALCKRIVDRHDGEIWVESEPGEGSTFRVALPPASSPSPPSS